MKYEIKGDMLPVVICHLEQGEQMMTQDGGMSWMSPNMRMETTKNGSTGQAVGRMFSGASFFQNIYTAEGGGGLISFASKFPGCIKAFEISPNNEMVFQKRVFLAAEMGVDLSIFFNKKIGTGVFGGEGFVMQKMSGNGLVFGEFDGSLIEYELKAGQTLLLDTGHLAAMTATCKMDIQAVPGMKNKLFGGEGLFNTSVTGPGHVWVQTMPLYGVARALKPYLPSN